MNIYSTPVSIDVDWSYFEIHVPMVYLFADQVPLMDKLQPFRGLGYLYVKDPEAAFVELNVPETLKLPSIKKEFPLIAWPPTKLVVISEGNPKQKLFSTLVHST